MISEKIIKKKYEAKKRISPPQLIHFFIHSFIHSDVELLIFHLRDRLQKRGAKGYIGLFRQLKIMDEDFDGQLSYGEFRKAMRDYKTGLEDFELKALFQFLSSLNG